MSKLDYTIEKNSSRLGFNLEDGKIHLGDLFIKFYLLSSDEIKQLGARKGFTHEYWHKLFSGLSLEKQIELGKSFKEDILERSEFQPELKQFCLLLYRMQEYRELHFVDGETPATFVEGDDIGIKDKSQVTLEYGNVHYQVYLSYFLTELISLSSESSLEGMDNYYKKQIDSTPDWLQRMTLETKRDLGKLATVIVNNMQSPLIESEFKAKLPECMGYLGEITREIRLKDSIEKPPYLNV